MLLVAYPDQPDMPTHFEFQYWVGAYEGSFWERIANFDFSGADGESILLAFIGMIVGGICFLCLVCCCIYKYVPRKQKIGVSYALPEENEYTTATEMTKVSSTNKGTEDAASESTIN